MRFDPRILAMLLISGTVSLIGADIQPAAAGLTVHEWGTFTSIAGENGMAVDWSPLDGPTDLPCFVHRFEFGAKANLGGTVRMETPVIYLYSASTTTADIRVTFRNGFITEWYPKANRVASYFGSGIPPKGPDIRQPFANEPDSIAWPEVKLAPAIASPPFPFEFTSSHYYAARSTDAAPLLVGREREKFLFYRGVGRFQPPIAVWARAGNQILVRNLTADPIPVVILFQNQDGKISYRVHGPIETHTTLESPQLSDLGSLKTEMERMLVSQGLFPKEAMAMVATWSDSWFEEGTRLFYITPTSVLDLVLPLEVKPAPRQIARVFVGRMELFTPSTRKAITDAMQQGDWRPLQKYGRFLEPIAASMGPGPWTKPLDLMRVEYLQRESACGNSNW
jgi:hypothetical protein